MAPYLDMYLEFFLAMFATTTRNDPRRPDIRAMFPAPLDSVAVFRILLTELASKNRAQGKSWSTETPSDN